MRTAIFLLTMISTLHGSSQSLTRIDKDTLITGSGHKIVVGTNMQLGTGTLPNGDFRYVTDAAMAWSRSGDPYDRKWNGQLVRVKKFRKEGNKRRGYTYSVLFGSEGLVEGVCEIENAIATGEVVPPENYTQKPMSSGTSGTSASLADDLRKLKDLFDQGALTREEYDAAKKKLINP